MIVKASSSVEPTFRFGVFELDPKAGELRKKGMKIRLQGQPVDILVMLLQRPGETVTREELQENLWPADTFVDFEQGLNNAMKRLRAALDDDALSARVIDLTSSEFFEFGNMIGANFSQEDAMMTSARDAVEKDYKAFAEAFHKGDLDTISQMYTEDAEFFVPEAPIIEGKQAIREAWRSIVGSGGNTVRVDVREVQESGELAYDTGRFTASAPDGSVLNAGKWIVSRVYQFSPPYKLPRQENPEVAYGQGKSDTRGFRDAS